MVRNNKWKLKNVSLGSRMIISFVLTVCIIAVVVSLQSYMFTSIIKENTFKVDVIKTKQNIFNYINNSLRFPEYVNEMNAAAAELGNMNLNDTELLKRLFLKQVSEDMALNNIYFANRDGGMSSVGRNGESLYFAYTDKMTKSPLNLMEIADDGSPVVKLETDSMFDPRNETWYKEASETKEDYWSGVYKNPLNGMDGITVTKPLLDSAGNVKGVFGTDFHLDNLNQYLSGIDVGENGRLFLIGSDGSLIAESDVTPAVKTKGITADRLESAKSSDPIMAYSWGIIKKTVLDNGMPVHGKYTVDGLKYYLDISKYSYNGKFQWYLVISMPETDLNSKTDMLSHWLSISIILFLALAVIFGLIISKNMLRPIQLLNRNALEICNGKWGSQIVTKRRDEIGDLTRSFNTMSLKIKESYDELIEKNNELQYLNSNLEQIVKDRTAELRKLSITDELTGQFNHRYIIDALSKRVKEWDRYHAPLAIMILDIDYFKNVNDTFGHLEGNAVLKEVALTLKNAIRTTDILGRYGGEEFLLILPNTNLDEAFLLGERLLKLVAGSRTGESGIQVTLSAGLASCETGQIKDLIRAADKKLYEAKESGRNRICR